MRKKLLSDMKEFTQVKPLQVAIYCKTMFANKNKLHIKGFTQVKSLISVKIGPKGFLTKATVLNMKRFTQVKSLTSVNIVKKVQFQKKLH